MGHPQLFLFVVFFFIEKHKEHALVPVTILRRNNIAWGNIAGILAFATETSLVFCPEREHPWSALVKSCGLS